jgi:hypothetical protein
VIVLEGASPEHDSSLVEEFRDYLKANKFVEQRPHSSQVHQEAYEVPQEWERSLDAFFAFWNGGLHGDDGRIVHYCNCSGPGCCQSRAVTDAKAQETLLWLLRGKPCTPVVSRWTKVGPCVDFWSRGQVFCVFRCILQLATEALPFNDAAAASRFSCSAAALSRDTGAYASAMAATALLWSSAG